MSSATKPPQPTLTKCKNGCTTKIICQWVESEKGNYYEKICTQCSTCWYICHHCEQDNDHITSRKKMKKHLNYCRTKRKTINRRVDGMLDSNTEKRQKIGMGKKMKTVLVSGNSNLKETRTDCTIGSGSVDVDRNLWLLLANLERDFCQHAWACKQYSA